MKRFSEQLNTQSKSIKLQASERRELRERVVSYMEYHPVTQATNTTKAVPTPFYTESFKMVRVRFSTIARISAAMAAIVLIVVPVLAERSVPGDGLYAIKVQFNEEVRSTLNFTPYQKIEWETERLNRRIAEARLLANEGRLTEEVEAEVAEAVKLHTENAQREIEVLRGEDADEATLATIALSTTLKVQSASLRDEDEDTDSPATEEVKPTNLLAKVIDETLSKQEASNASSSVPSYDKMMARVELNTTRAYELLASLELNSNDERYLDITRRIEDIQRSVQEAIQNHESKDEEARKILVDSLQRTQRLIVFMTQIEVDKDFDVEEIVPVILTPEEEVQKIDQYRHDVSKQIELIEAAVVLQKNKETLEKAEYSLGLLKDSQLKIATSTNYAEVKVVSENSLALAKDTMLLLKADAQKATSTEEVVDETDTEVEKASTTDKVEVE